MKTFDELTEWLAERVDEVTLLELLGINSQDLILAFSDRIESKFDLLQELSDE